MRIYLFIVLLLLNVPGLSHAALNECIGVYVGRISVDSQAGVDQVVFLKTPDSASGSYWVNFSGWAREAKREALSVLLAAKASRHGVDVYTTAEDNCSIGSRGMTLKKVHISTNP